MVRSRGFEKYFRAFSYLAALSGLLALFVSGGVGIVGFTFFVLLALLAWTLEDTRWQVSDRLSLAIVSVAIVAFLADWRLGLTGFASNEIFAAKGLARLVLLLSTIKLLQRKVDKDWIFIYIIAFFEILLAAGMSISPFYLVPLFLYLLSTTSAMIAFEIRKTSREVLKKQVENLETEYQEPAGSGSLGMGFGRLPLLAAGLLIAITVFAVPLFFALPRVGGAGIGGDVSSTTRLTGFSDSVRLGAIGRLRRNNAVVMRVRIDRNDNSRLKKLLWRGVALDSFDGKSWSKSRPLAKEVFLQTGANRFVLDRAGIDGKFTVQTVYMEPLNTSLLFTLPRPVVVLTNSAEVRKDIEGAISAFPPRYGRLSYRIYSDTYIPEPDVLRKDASVYGRDSDRYLSLPKHLDPRIGRLAAKIVDMAGADNRYDISKSIEQYLQNELGYTLELKAGGEDPLADFLFNVREGHCEYFASALAVMLRTQGIATRIVNGFQQGDYNEAAGVYVVRQRHAHSWVEAYFPEQKAWVPFDPTPFAGQYSDRRPAGIFGSISEYAEALETFWIRYFVAYDTNEQRSLFRSFQEKLSTGGKSATNWFNAVRFRLEEWWQSVRGDRGFQASALAVGFGIGYILAAALGVFILVWLVRAIKRTRWWKTLIRWVKKRGDVSVVEFYRRMSLVLERRGFVRKPHQTPLEFASALEMPPALRITEAYHRVRFGGRELSEQEKEKIELWLEDMAAIKHHEKDTKNEKG